MRAEKQLLLDEIEDKLEGSKAVIFAKYQSLGPDLSDDFRGQLRDAGGSFTAVKKRVLLKAAEKQGIQMDLDTLAGHIGVMIAHEDPISATKVLFKFAKENKETLEVLAGHFDGQLCSAEDVKAISQLPSQDEMTAQFLGLLEAPMAQTLSVMEALLTSVMHCLENKSQEEGSE